MENILAIAYSAATFVIIAAYIPQIYTLITCETRAEALSLQAYGLWTMTAFIAVLYAFTHTTDPLIWLANGVAFLGNASIFTLGYYNRFIKFPKTATLAEVASEQVHEWTETVSEKVSDWSETVSEWREHASETQLDEITIQATPAQPHAVN